jgi:hypothetical protein
MTSTRPASAEWLAPRRSAPTVAVSTAPTTSTPSPQRQDGKAQLKLDVPSRPGQVDDEQLAPRFCVLGALSGRSPARPCNGTSLRSRIHAQAADLEACWAVSTGAV